MAISKEFLDDLRERLTLSDVISKYIKVTRAGREFKACCPFHKEKTASFTINDAKGFYHCFGCGAHGDALRFLTDYGHLGFMEAVEHLCSLAGVEVPKQDRGEDIKYQQRKTIYDLLKVAETYYKEQLSLPESRKFKQYLIDRGFSSSEFSEFGIGYAPFDNSNLKKKLELLGFKDKDMIDSGLFRVSTKDNNELYPFFRHRIMFPVHDVRNRVVAFGGRIIPENYGGGKSDNAPKYINSSETEVFHKGSTLYGLNNAMKSISNGDNAVVVEGYLDVIALHKAGFKGAVAPLGTALTEGQIEELWKRMPENNRMPILCFDGDGAGQRAASRALVRILPILKPDTSAKFAFLPEKHDPDSLIKEQGFSAMKKVLDESISLFDMLWLEESKNRDLSQPEALAGLRVSLNKRVSEIADNDIKEIFINQIKQRFNELYSSNTLSKKASSSSYSNNKYKNNRAVQGINSAYRQGQDKISGVKSKKLLQEKILLALIINNPWLYEEDGEKLGMYMFSNDSFNKIKETMIDILSEEHITEREYFIGKLESAGYDVVINEIFDKSIYTHASFIKPETDDETVLAAWHEIWEFGLK